jgi:hypothetical protein
MLAELDLTCEVPKEQYKKEKKGLDLKLPELQRQAKEQAKLSALEQARLEEETYENKLAVLLSVHKDQGETWDWAAICAFVAPAPPQRYSYHELRAKQNVVLSTALFPHSSRPQDRDAEVIRARARDEQEFQDAYTRYREELREGERLAALASRILNHDVAAYAEALAELSPLRELSELGSSLEFATLGDGLFECALKVNGQQVIPADVKTITATGKMSVKAMPKGRFHDIYQDYASACVLRVAREVFAMLPIETVLITATADCMDSQTGRTAERPVFSAIITRTILSSLDFEHLDPSDALTNFLHRGDFSPSRKTGSFEPIVPLTGAEAKGNTPGIPALTQILSQVKELQEALSAGTCRLQAAFAPRNA